MNFFEEPGSGVGELSVFDSIQNGTNWENDETSATTAYTCFCEYLNDFGRQIDKHNKLNSGRIAYIREDFTILLYDGLIAEYR